MQKVTVAPEQSIFCSQADLNELFFLRGNKEKFNIEFSRYKQDCRKRAIDIAQYRLSELVKDESIDFDLKDNKGKLIPKSVTQDTLLIAMADKYYNWLISIPNE